MSDEVLRNDEAECVVLGTMMLTHNYTDQHIQKTERLVSSLIEALGTNPRVFARTEHQLIYSAIVDIYTNTEDKVVEALTVKDSLEKAGDLNRAGGELYLYDLQAKITETDSVHFYAKTVKECANRRQTHDIGVRLQHASKSESISQDQLEDMLSEVDKLNEFQSDRRKPEIKAWDDIEVTRREWLVDGWLPANTVTMFTGEGGAGKSWLTLQMICQVACGFRDAYLDPEFHKVADVAGRRDVVFATYEDEPEEIKRRLETLETGVEWIEDSVDTIKTHTHVVDMRGLGSVWGPGAGKNIGDTGYLLPAGEDLRVICEDTDARLLVIDPLSGAFGGNENDRASVYDFVSDFRKWGDEVKCATLLIGHLPKNAEGKTAGFSGSTAWEASVRSLWMLGTPKTKDESEKTKGGDKESRKLWALSNLKNNYAPLQPRVPLIKHKTGWWSQAESSEDAADGYEAYQTRANHQPNNREDNDNDGDSAEGYNYGF